jgi:hypothetical protein
LRGDAELENPYVTTCDVKVMKRILEMTITLQDFGLAHSTTLSRGT